MARGPGLLEIQIELAEVSPLVWRRLRLLESYSLEDFDHIIQIAMGWQRTHLSFFTINGQNYSSTELSDAVTEPIKLQHAFALSNKEFEFVYAGVWRNSVRLISRQGGEFLDPFPRCLGGAGACPPEDVGGAAGYQDFLEAIANPARKDHTKKLAWVGGSFDPACFSVRQANAGLTGWFLARFGARTAASESGQNQKRIWTG